MRRGLRKGVNFLANLRVILRLSALAIGLILTVWAGTRPVQANFPYPGVEVLPHTDATLYHKIFRLQDKGQWILADALIKKLSDKLLLGHVMAQRFLHPTKYRSRYKELKE